MPRHIHIPKQHEWTIFLANTAEIDNYLVSSNEIVRTRTAPAPRRLALELTNCCNLVWDFVVPEPTPDPLRLAEAIDRRLVDGALQEGVIFQSDLRIVNDPNEPRWSRTHSDKTPLDEKTDFLHSNINEALGVWAARFSELDERMLDFLSRGFVPIDDIKYAGMFAWLTQYQFGFWCPYVGLNGMTGRFLTNSLRLRWGMPLWQSDIKPSAWKENLKMYSKIWMKKGSFSPIDQTVLPNLEKVQFASQ